MTHDEAHAAAHEKAIAEYTAESYLLDELSDAEAEAFERHYLDCRVCYQTIRAGAAMLAAGQAVVREDNEPVPLVEPPLPPKDNVVVPFRKRVKQWIPSAAAAALLVVVGYQGFFRPGPPPIETLTPGRVITGTMRASESEDYVMHFVGDRARQEQVDITDRSYPEYRIELRSASGKLVLSTEVTAEEARSETGVPFLIRPLPAGRYLLTIVGVRKEGNRTAIDRRNVVVQ